MRCLYSTLSCALRLRNVPLSHLSLATSFRYVSFKVSAANFENEVLQSQQAICLVYHIENSNCSSYLRHAEKLVDDLNSNTTLLPKKEKEMEETSNDSKEEQGIRHACLKFCTVNADENRNLASAFSVERAKLPITFFIMQGTIIDKVVGHIKETRLQSILCRFIEHYQKEMNVDLLVARGKESVASGGMSSPLPAASTADLRSGASTTHMIQHLVSSLSGADRIRLPEEAEKLDGLRKTIQETKRKAYGELVELRREIGLEVRQLSESEKESKYYRSSPYNAMATISALEALFLARCYAAIGDVARENIIWAKRELTSSFEYGMTRTSLLRQLLALIEVNVVKGDLRITALTAERLLERFPREKEEDSSVAENNNEKRPPLCAFLTHYVSYARRLQSSIDQYIDSRDFEVTFPSTFAEEMFVVLKQSRKLLSSLGSSGVKLLSSKSAKADEEPWSEEVLKLVSSTTFSVRSKCSTNPAEVLPSSQSVSPSSSENAEESSIIARITSDQLRHAKVVLSCLIQLHIKDPKGQAARSRLASLVY